MCSCKWVISAKNRICAKRNYEQRPPPHRQICRMAWERKFSPWKPKSASSLVYGFQRSGQHPLNDIRHDYVQLSSLQKINLIFLKGNGMNKIKVVLEYQKRCHENNKDII